ncbi:Hypothetical predicted protein [Octopus vulgaris]|uniref:Secreted protein n=1 Tax=Octopus vulgaris TaxID=6645 RepID=A0AA36FBU6_OCTVU|nr:Hypothetical predicted protein [Octopus vulgaris]
MANIPSLMLFLSSMSLFKSPSLLLLILLPALAAAAAAAAARSAAVVAFFVVVDVTEASFNDKVYIEKTCAVIYSRNRMIRQVPYFVKSVFVQV